MTASTLSPFGSSAHPTSQGAFTLPFEAISRHELATVGGKGANLGALTQAGIPVPPGFCVTTSAYDRFMSGLPDATVLFQALDALDGKDVAQARRAAEAMRAALAHQPLPPDVARGVITAWQALGPQYPLAVRSSATAEDLPGASFAGQQDTYLNIQGEEALLDAVKRCWISLFTDRAVLYRARSHFGHHSVKLSVVVQRLVDPDVSGILFTADPISGHRGIVSIDAGFGLGEALVGGLISADLYRVDRRSRKVIEATPGDKAIAIRSVPGGGTRQETLPPDQRTARVLDDAHVLALASLGERIEAHYGGVPQDIEWCMVGSQIYIVQARPVTSLFPLPEPRPETDALHVYVSFGHVQMMTEAMPRLAREVWGLVLPLGKGGKISLNDPPVVSPTMKVAANRLFIDTTPVLQVPRMRKVLLAVLGHIYEEAARTVQSLTDRPSFQQTEGSLPPMMAAFGKVIRPMVMRIPGALFWQDPEKGAQRADQVLTEIVAAVKARILAQPTPGARIRRSMLEMNALFGELRLHMPRMAVGILAQRALARAVKGSWGRGVEEEVDRLLRGLPGNVTTEMDLAVGDLTDLVRPYPALADLLRTQPWQEVRAQAPGVPGGSAFISGLDRFLEQYGMRGAGEIDLSRPRWRDNPSLLLRVIVGGLSSGAAGEHRVRHQAQAAEGEGAAVRLKDAAGQGLLGPLRGWWVGRLCRVIRSGMGLREHPKFTIIRILGLVRVEVLAAGELLVSRGQLSLPEDVWQLGFEELADALDHPQRDLRAEATARRETFRQDQSLRPPLVISSDGETPVLAINVQDMPAGALPGTAASKGVVEGLARVIHDPEREVLHAGEILVAPFTDPGWTPLFVHAAGVVTEVGGLMTHGAVVAREYGIPAVVSVKGATESIKTGQRIRVDGTRGFVELLGEA